MGLLGAANPTVVVVFTGRFDTISRSTQHLAIVPGYYHGDLFLAPAWMLALVDGCAVERKFGEWCFVPTSTIKN